MKIRTKQNRTVRMNCYETNSSSSHSLTIQTKGGAERRVEELVVNNVLYPANLRYYTNSYGESSHTVADTKDKKAAMCYQWLVNMLDEVSEYDHSIIFDKYRIALGYTGIEFDQKYPNFWPGDESETYFSFSDDLEEDLETLEDLINLVLDDTQEIVDSDTPY